VLVIEKFDEFGDDLIGRFFHEPVAGIANDHAFNVRCDKPALLNEEIARSLFAGQNKHGHGQGGLGEAGEIVRVLLERAKVLKTRAHAAGSGIRFRVKAAVAFRDGMGRVGGEIVPEMLEIDTFATVDESKRRLTIEMEMPKIAHEPNVAPVSYSRQERVHQRNAIDLVRILRRVGVSDHQSDIVPDNLNVLEAKFAYERVDVLRHCGLGVAIGRRGGLTGSAQIRGDYAVGACEFGDQGAPHVAGFGVAM
jgi:hypothetical protein